MSDLIKIYTGGKSITSNLLQEERSQSNSVTGLVSWVSAEEGHGSEKGGKATIRVGLRGERLPGLNPQGKVAVTGVYVEIKVVRQRKGKIIISIYKVNPVLPDEKDFIYNSKGQETELPKKLSRYQAAVSAALKRSTFSSEDEELCFYEK